MTLPNQRCTITQALQDVWDNWQTRFDQCYGCVHLQQERPFWVQRQQAEPVECRAPSYNHCPAILDLIEQAQQECLKAQGYGDAY